MTAELEQAIEHVMASNHPWFTHKQKVCEAARCMAMIDKLLDKGFYVQRDDAGDHLYFVRNDVEILAARETLPLALITAFEKVGA